jgi:hypothetical protein
MSSVAGKKQRKKNNVVRMNKSFRVNSALIIFGVILLYVLASIFLSLRKEPITTYKVNSSKGGIIVFSEIDVS